MKTPIRVLQVVTNMDRGGLETMLMNYYRHIDRTLVQFDFLTHRDIPAAYDAEIRSLGGVIFHLPKLNPMSVSYRKALHHFFGMHQEYCIVHSHLDCTSAYPLRAAAKARVPNRIAHVHSTNQDKNLKYPIKMGLKKLIPHYATELFACGDAAGRWAFPNKTYTVMKNAVDSCLYLPDENRRTDMRKELGIADNEMVVGHVGRFNPSKNHAFMIDLFLAVTKIVPNAKLLLVGDGDGRKNVERKVKMLNLSQNVIFTGIRSDVSYLMQAMDIFLLPSLYEGLPVTIVEAQASGLPCVISGNVPRDCVIVDDRVASVSLSADPETWANEIVRAAKSGRINCQQQIIASGYDINSCAAWLEDYYLQMATKYTATEKHTVNVSEAKK